MNEILFSVVLIFNRFKMPKIIIRFKDLSIVGPGMESDRAPNGMSSADNEKIIGAILNLLLMWFLYNKRVVNR